MQARSHKAGRRALAKPFLEAGYPIAHIMRAGALRSQDAPQLNDHFAFSEVQRTPNGGCKFPVAGRGRADEVVRKFGDETGIEGRLANPQVRERPENTKLLYIL